ncbi:MAG TPA: hypothetical protein GXX75_25830 [Clostridiales bacterium]|nr:hypothetical protein [Clostridiales bacterium]
MDSIGRFIAVLVVVVMVAIIPLQYAAQGQEEVLYGAVDTISAEFADRVRHQGYITIEMYGDYLMALGRTGDSYDIGLEIAHPVTGREVAEKEAEKEAGEKAPAALAKYEPAAATTGHRAEIFSLGHVHTDDCYAGHRHTAKPTYTHYHAHSGNCQLWITYRYWEGECASCHTVYTWQLQNWANNQPTGGWHGGCPKCGLEGYRVAGKDKVLTGYYWTCGYNKDDNGDGIYDNSVPYDVTYAYGGQALPQGYSLGTVYGGCWSYHNHINSYGHTPVGLNGPYNGNYDTIQIYDYARARANGVPEYSGGNLNYDYSFYYNRINVWASEIINRYGGVTCSVPQDLRITYNYKTTMGVTSSLGGFNYSTEVETYITVRLYPRLLENNIVFDYEVTLTVPNYFYSSIHGGNMPPCTLKSADGHFTKNYFTISDLANLGDITNIADYFYSLIKDKNSTLAKVCPLVKQPYTNHFITYDDWGNQIYNYGFVYGQPVIGYRADAGYSTLAGGMNRIYAYGQVSLCAYQAGPPNQWNGCGLTEDTTLDCGDVVTSLTPTNPVQTVYKGDPIITSATATMMDGSVKTVSCTASGYDSNSLGTQTVTLTYHGLVDNAKTTGTKSCTVDVTVKSRKTLTGITVLPASQEVTRYTDPAFTVTASYSDGTSSQVLGVNVLGFDGVKLGEQTVTLSYTEDGVGRTATASVTVCRLTATCPVCGTVYELDDDDVDRGCPTCSGAVVSISVSPEEVTVRKGEELPITVTAYYRDGRTGILSGWDSNYDPEKTGLQDVTVTYDNFTAHVMVTVSSGKTCPVCGNIYSLNPDGTDPGCPVCRSEVVSISAAPEDMTVERYGELPITVTATFRDGHTEEVDGWGTDFTADTTGEFDVPIYYKSAVTSVHVTVLEEGLATCPYCHTVYSRHEYPKGCPVCSRTLDGIEAQLRNGGNRVIYRSDLNLQVILIYRDTHREITYTGFTYTGFDSSVLGVQTVTVTYGEFTTTLTVEVVDTLDIVTCPVCGSQYYLNEDGADPGCPYCSGEGDAERAVFYFDTVYTEEILKKLLEDGVYHLQDGDYFTLTVSVTRDSARTRIIGLFRGRKSENKRKESRTYGGEVTI